MIQQFLIALLATLFRALIAYICGEALRLMFDQIALDTPITTYIAVRVLTRVTVAVFMMRIKLVIRIRRRRSDSEHGK